MSFRLPVALGSASAEGIATAFCSSERQKEALLVPVLKQALPFHFFCVLV